MYGKKGFTLVEMITALMLLSIMASVTVFSVKGYVEQAKEANCEITASQIGEYYLAQVLLEESDGLTDKELIPLDEIKKISNIDIINNCYKSPCGGTCRIEFSKDNMEITRIVCSKHGVVYESGGSETDDGKTDFLKAVHNEN